MMQRLVHSAVGKGLTFWQCGKSCLMPESAREKILADVEKIELKWE